MTVTTRARKAIGAALLGQVFQMDVAKVVYKHLTPKEMMKVLQASKLHCNEIAFYYKQNMEDHLVNKLEKYTKLEKVCHALIGDMYAMSSQGVVVHTSEEEDVATVNILVMCNEIEELKKEIADLYLLMGNPERFEKEIDFVQDWVLPWQREKLEEGEEYFLGTDL